MSQSERGRKPSLNATCQKCGCGRQIGELVCRQCGSHFPPMDVSAASAPSCAICHQSKYLDSLTRRCIRCQPIQLRDLQPELQNYARRAGFQRYWTPSWLIVTALVFIIVYGFTDKGGLLFIIPIISVILVIFAVAVFLRMRNYLLRYYRLNWVLENEKPVDAELKYKKTSGSENSTYYYFYVSQIAADSFWPINLKEKIKIDPPESDEAVKDQTLWAKVYLDPDMSGNAVIRIANSTFVSVKESHNL